MERIATITPIATRNTPFTISPMMPQRMPNTPKAVRTIKPNIANPMCCAVCLKFAVAVISVKILPAGLEIFTENRRLDLAFPSNPGITFAPRTKMTD